MEVFNNRTLFSGFEHGIIDKIRQLPSDSYYLLSAGRFIELDAIKPNDIFQLNFRLLGGKGGFGSVLRSFRISKSSNQLMCRDLNGRRVRDVKEEERQQKWVAKTEDREKEAKRKKKKKYDKLKQGGPKHQFADVEYLRTRDLVLDEVEDAIEAGLAVFDAPVSEEPKLMIETQEEAGPSGINSLETGFVTTDKKKRKLEVGDVQPVGEKKARLDIEHQAPVKLDTKKEKKVVPVKEPTEEIDYPEIDLKKFNSVDELSALGIDHLKHALQTRGLKCGGTLDQRAERLFSIKGLKPKKYPKKLLALQK